MQKRKNKKAQFYLIAAVIIVIIIIGMAGVANYVTIREEPTDFYDIGENLGLEGAWVIDQGIYTQTEDLDTRIKDFTSKFADYVAATGEEFELTIVYGDSQSGVIERYDQTSIGEDCVTISDSRSCIQNYEVGEPDTLRFTGGSTTFVVGDSTYEVTLKENQNFLFVMTTSKDFERYIYENIE